jgi:8-oxo-dGTP pyrophosphatase MutT (NUDIX family)
VDRQQLIKLLIEYKPADESEKYFPEDFLTLLQHPDAYQRLHLPGHITGSAWIIDDERKQVLLVHHGTLNRWMQPGGHADGDEDVLRVALREANEETGVSDFQLLESGLFDIDIHTIPARKGFPEHQHYDVRFLLQASPQHPIAISEESHDVAWRLLNELPALTNNSESIMRMVRKVQKLL